ALEFLELQAATGFGESGLKKVHRGDAENAEIRRRHRMELNQITEAIIGAAIEVHKRTGPGLLESAYRRCMCRELTLRGIPFECERALPVEYKGELLDCGYRIDLLVMGLIVVELKSVEKLDKIHEAQLLTYMKLGQW